MSRVMQHLMIEEWQFREQPDDLLAELYAACAPLHLEAQPDDPRVPLADEIAELRHLPAPEDGITLVARAPDEEIAALAWLRWHREPGWDHVLFTNIQVLPGWRRQGLGRLLLDRAGSIASEHGLRLIMIQTRANVPAGEAFCRHVGAEPAMVTQENRLDLRGIDRDLVDRWLADGPRRAPGYELIFLAGPTPPDQAENVAEVLKLMNTAPREDLDVGDSLITTQTLFEYDEAMIAAGKTRWAYYAVHRESGQFVGLTDLSIRPGTPDRVHVGDTGVDSAHRGHALGKWLKAAMTRRILDELPAVRWVITANAGSNDAMLAINRQLGFRTAAVHTTWQIAVGRLLERLTERPDGS